MAQLPEGAVQNVHDQPPGFIQCSDLNCESDNPSQPFNDLGALNPPTPMNHRAIKESDPGPHRTFGPGKHPVPIIGG